MRQLRICCIALTSAFLQHTIPQTFATNSSVSGSLKIVYDKCPKILYTEVSDEMA